MATIIVGSRIYLLRAARMAGEHTTLLLPLCPSCGKPMGLSRVVPATAGLSELQTHGCADCRVWLTEAKERWVKEAEPWIHNPRPDNVP